MFFSHGHTTPVIIETFHALDSSKQVLLVGDIHAYAHGSAAIEHLFFKQLYQHETAGDGEPVTVFWETGPIHDFGRHSKAHHISYFISPKYQHEELFIFAGQYLMNCSVHKRICVKDIEVRKAKFCQIFKWLINEIDPVKTTKAGSEVTLNVSFGDFVQELEEQIEKINQEKLSFSQKELVVKICEFKNSCKAAIDATRVLSFEDSIVNWYLLKNKYSKCVLTQHVRAAAKRAFLDAVDAFYVCALFDLSLAAALSQEKNKKVIIVAGVTHLAWLREQLITEGLQTEGPSLIFPSLFAEYAHDPSLHCFLNTKSAGNLVGDKSWFMFSS